jgi:hypothetical protein
MVIKYTYLPKLGEEDGLEEKKDENRLLVDFTSFSSGLMIATCIANIAINTTYI